MPRPNFFIVGAPKCGTTALVEYLRGHPQVFVSTPKEPHYFATDLPGYRQTRTLADYEALFAAAGTARNRIGEASVFYMYSREAAKRVHTYAPDASIVVMVRNPLDLIPSFHAQLVYSRDENEPDLGRAWRLMRKRRWGECLPRHCRAPELLRYDRTALLGGQLERWLELFGPQRVKVVCFDDFAADTDGAYREVLEFLRLPDDGRRGFQPVNARKVQRHGWVANFTERTPQPLIALALAAKRMLRIRRLGLLDALRRWNTTRSSGAACDDWLRQEMIDIYADDVRRLGRLLDRDLSHWLRDARCQPAAALALADGI